MKQKIVTFVVVLLLTIGVSSYLNSIFEIVAFNPFRCDGEKDFKVLTWNIHCFSKADNLTQRKISEQILKEDADIILLNEYPLDSCLVIDSLLSGYYPYKEDVGATTQIGNVIYSKCRLIESGKLNEDFSNALFCKLWLDKDSLYILGCHLVGNNSEGQIEINDADSLRRVKTFWEYYRNAQEKRKEDAHFLKKAVKESTLPMIVMGDMNDFNHSAPMDSLMDAGMKNAWWKGGFGYGATYHEGWLRLRIDHIYYNEKLKLKGVKVVETDLSDHNILVADFEFAN